MAIPVNAKSILSKLKHVPDPFFGITYSMNLYRGCQHGCIYCDSRSSCYQIKNFDNIEVKINAPELLAMQLKRLRNKATIGFGSMNDPYMPVEDQLLMSRKALEIISIYHWPVHIITKSNLIIRDLEFLIKISKVYCAVSFTITGASDELSKIIEPRAPVSSLRFKALQAVAGAGIYCGVVISPVLPYITDSMENIAKLIELSAEHNASYILFWPGMTLREGQREYYYHELDKYFPGLAEKYINTYQNAYSCRVPDASQLVKHAENLCNKYKIPLKMNFYTPVVPVQKKLL